VGREQDRAARALEFFDQLPQLTPGLRIEPGGGLIQEQEIGIADERAGQREPLLLAARERADARPPLLLQLNELDHVLRRGAFLEEAAEQTHRLLDGELVGKLRFLELDSEPLLQGARVGFPLQA
jgi:hypothetical protein